MTTMTPDVERKLDTIRKLLAKAERAATTEEADAYTAKATDLMMRYSIDEAVIGHTEKAATDTIGKRVIVATTYPLPKITLLAGISQTFGCKAIRTSRGGSENIVEVWGFDSDLLIVETLYASLLIQADRELARVYVTKHPREHGRSFKTSFYTGFANTVFNRLANQRRGVVRETEDRNPGTAVALRDRSVAVQGALDTAHPRTHTVGGPNVTSRSGLDQGKAAGNRADLGQTRLNGTGRQAIGR